MANAYSHLHNFSNPVVDQGVDRAGQMLLHRQQKYDHNKQKLQSLQDEFSSLDMAKDVDKEYAENRLLKIKEMTDKYLQGVDLSDDSFTSAISSNMHQFIDDNIINAVASTRRMRSEDKEVEEMRKKNPDKHNEANQRWAMARSGRNEYLQSQEVGEVYRGGYGFVEYRDLQSKLSKHAPKIAEAVGAEYVVLGNGNGYFRSLDKYKTVDRRKLEAALDGLLDEKDKTQMAVNTWATYGQMSEDQLKNSYDATYRARLANVDQEIERFQNYADNINDEAKKKPALETIESLKEDRVSIEKNLNYDTVNNNIGRSGIESVLYNQSLKAPYLEAYARAPELINSEVYKLDVETRRAERDLMRIQIAQQRAETARLKALKDAKDKEEEDAPATPIKRGKVEGGELNLIQANQERKAEIVESLNQTVLDSFRQGGETDEVAKANMGKFLAKVTEDDLSGTTIEKDGVTIKIRDVIMSPNGAVELVENENYNAISKYVVNRMVKNPIESKIDGHTEGLVKGLEGILVEAAGVERTYNRTSFTLDRLPTNTHAYVYNESKGLYEVSNNTEGKTYKELLDKKSRGESLTKGEEKTLKVSILKHLLLDKELDRIEGLRTEVERYLEDEVLSDVTESISFLPQTQAGSLVLPLRESPVPIFTGAFAPDFYLSDFNRGDFTYNTGQALMGSTRISSDPNTLIKNYLNKVSETTKAEDYQNVISTVEVSLDAKNHPNDWGNVNKWLQSKGIVNLKTTETVALDPQTSEGKLTGGYYLTVPNIAEKILLPKEDAETIGFKSFQQPEQPFISADVPKPFVKDFGKVKLNQDKEFYEMRDIIIAQNYSADLTEEIKTFSENVVDNYTFLFEPYSGIYTLKLLDDKGDVVQITSLAQKDYTEQEFIKLLSNIEESKKRALLAYIRDPRDVKGKPLYK